MWPKALAPENVLDSKTPAEDVVNSDGNAKNHTRTKVLIFNSLNAMISRPSNRCGQSTLIKIKYFFAYRRRRV